ncbi:calmodulin-binding transcription activator 3 isoform X1 [Tanacetum coccineum]
MALILLFFASCPGKYSSDLQDSSLPPRYIPKVGEIKHLQNTGFISFIIIELSTASAFTTFTFQNGNIPVTLKLPMTAIVMQGVKTLGRGWYGLVCGRGATESGLCLLRRYCLDTEYADYSCPSAPSFPFHHSAFPQNSSRSTRLIRKFVAREPWGICLSYPIVFPGKTSELGMARGRLFVIAHDARLDADSPVSRAFTVSKLCIKEMCRAGGELKKLDSFGRWMDKEMGGDCEDSLMASNSEVAAEFVTGNVIRCQAPLCGAGRVPFYITCNNRIACSEVREFEYVQKPSTIAAANATCAEEEFGLLIRLSKLLSSGAERKWSGSVVNCEKCKLKDLFHSLIDDKEGCWKRITEVFKGNCQDLLIQNLMKDKLYDQLLYEAHEGCQGLRMLDERGQGIIHLAAALGYEWAISPVVAAGMSPSFQWSHQEGPLLHCTLSLS